MSAQDNNKSVKENQNEPEKRLSKVAENSVEVEASWNEMNGAESSKTDVDNIRHSQLILFAFEMKGSLNGDLFDKRLESERAKSDADNSENADHESEVLVSSEDHSATDQEIVQNPDEGFLSEEGDSSQQKYFLSCAERRSKNDRVSSNESMSSRSSCHDGGVGVSPEILSPGQIGYVTKRMSRLSVRRPMFKTVDSPTMNRQQRRHLGRSEERSTRRTERPRSYDRGSTGRQNYRNNVKDGDVMDGKKWPHDKFRLMSDDLNAHHRDAPTRYGRGSTSRQTVGNRCPPSANRLRRDNRDIDYHQRTVYPASGRGGRQYSQLDEQSMSRSRGRFTRNYDGSIKYSNGMSDSYGHNQWGSDECGGKTHGFETRDQRDTGYSRRGNPYSSGGTFRGGNRGGRRAGGDNANNYQFVQPHFRRPPEHLSDRHSDFNRRPGNNSSRGRWEEGRNGDSIRACKRGGNSRRSFRITQRRYSPKREYQHAGNSSLSEPCEDSYERNNHTNFYERDTVPGWQKDLGSRGNGQDGYDTSTRKGTYNRQSNTKSNQHFDNRPTSSTPAPARYSTQSQNIARKFNPALKAFSNATIKPPRFNKQRMTRNISECSSADARGLEESTGIQRTHSYSQQSKVRPLNDPNDVKSADECQQRSYAPGAQLIIGTQPSLPEPPRQGMTKEAESHVNSDGYISSRPFIPNGPPVGRAPNQLASAVFPSIGLVNLASLGSQPTNGVQQLYYLTPQGLASAVLAPHQLGVIDPCQNQLLVNAPIQMTSLQPQQQHQLAALAAALPAGQQPNPAWNPHQSSQIIYPSLVAPQMDQSRNTELMLGYQQPMQQLQSQLVTSSQPSCVLGAGAVQTPPTQQSFFPNGESLAQSDTQILSAHDINRAAYIQSALMQQQHQGTDPQFFNFQQGPRQSNEMAAVSNYLGQQLFGNARQMPNGQLAGWQPRQRGVAPFNAVYNDRYDSYPQRWSQNQNRVAALTDQIQYLNNSIPNVAPQQPLPEQGQINDASTVAAPQINSNALQ